MLSRIGQDDRPRRVTEILLVATEAGPTYHWRYFAQLEGGGSLEINSGGSKLQGTTRLELTLRDYEYSARSKIFAKIPFAVNNNVNVQRLIDVLLRNGRDRYKLHESGLGCRYWCTVIAGDFERDGIFGVGTATWMWQYFEDTTREVGPPIMYPLQQGTFY